MRSDLPHLNHKTYPKATPAQKARRNPPPPVPKYYSAREYRALRLYQDCHPDYIPIFVPLNQGYDGPRPSVSPGQQVLPKPAVYVRPTIPRTSPTKSVGSSNSSPPVNRVKGSVQFGRTQPIAFQFGTVPYGPKAVQPRKAAPNKSAEVGSSSRHSQRAPVPQKRRQAPQSPPKSNSSLSPRGVQRLPQITLKTLREAKEKLTRQSQQKKSASTSGSSPGSRFDVLSTLGSSEGSTSSCSSQKMTLKTVQRWVAKGTVTPSPAASSSGNSASSTPSPKRPNHKGKSAVVSPDTRAYRNVGKTAAGVAQRSSSSSETSPKMGVYHYNYGKPFVPQTKIMVAPRATSAATSKFERGSTSGVKSTSVPAAQQPQPVRREKFRPSNANLKKAEVLLNHNRSTAVEINTVDEDKESSLLSHFRSVLKGMNAPVRVRVSGRTGERLFCKVADEVGYKVGPVSVSRVLNYIYGAAPTPVDISFIISKRGWAHVFQNGFYVGYAPLSMPKWVMLRLAGEQKVYPTIIGTSGAFQIRHKDRWPSLQEYIMYDLFHGYSRLDAVYVYDPVTKRTSKGSSGFCWLPLYLKSGCSVVEIPSCPFVKKGVLEKRFGPQKYVRVHDKLHLSPTYGTTIKGEADRLVGAAEIEEVTESLPNLTTDSSIGEMVNNVLRKTVLGANSRFSMTLDDVLHNALTASFAAKKVSRIRIPQSLTSDEKQLLETVWGHNNFDYGSNTPGPHAFLNAMRATFNAEYIRAYKHLAVSDVGGNCVTHVLMGSTNVHVCNPICDAKDFGRQIATVPALMSEATKTQRKAEDFARFTLALNALSYCRKPLGSCVVPSTVLTMVDVYDISLEVLIEGMEKKGALVARLCFMYPPELIHQDGYVSYPHTNLSVERLDGKVIWTVGSCGDVYCHDVRNVLSYLTTGRVVSSSKLLYNVELLAQRGPYMDIMVSLTQGTSTLLSPRRRYICWRDGFSAVKVILTQPNPQVVTVYLDRDFCRRTLMYLGNVCTSFDDRTFEYAVSSLRSNMTMMVVGAKIVHKKVEISNNIVLEVASSLLKEAVNRRSKTVKFHKSKYSVPSRLAAFLSYIWNFVRSKFEALKNWIYGPADGHLQSLLNGSTPFVEDTPSSVDVELSDATSNVNVTITGLDEVFDLAAQLAWVTQEKITEEASNGDKKKKNTTPATDIDDFAGLDNSNTSFAGQLRGGGGNWYDFLIRNHQANANGDSTRAMLWRLCRKLTRLIKYWDTIPILRWAKAAVSLLLVGLKWIFSRTLCPTMPEEEIIIPKQNLWDKLVQWGGLQVTKGGAFVSRFIDNCTLFVCTRTISIIQHCQTQLSKFLSAQAQAANTALKHKLACFCRDHNLPFFKQDIKPVITESKWKSLSKTLFNFVRKVTPAAAGISVVGATTYVLITNENIRERILRGWQYLNQKVFKKYFVDKVKAAYLLVGALIYQRGLSVCTLISSAPQYYLLSAGSLGRRLLSGDLSTASLIEALMLLNRVSELREVICAREDTDVPVQKIIVDTNDIVSEARLLELQQQFKDRVQRALTVDLSKSGNPKREPQAPAVEDEHIEPVVRQPMIPTDNPIDRQKGKKVVVEAAAPKDFDTTPSNIALQVMYPSGISSHEASTSQPKVKIEEEVDEKETNNTPRNVYNIELIGERKSESYIPQVVPGGEMSDAEALETENTFLRNYCSDFEEVPAQVVSDRPTSIAELELATANTIARRSTTADADDERRFSTLSEDSLSTIALTDTADVEIEKSVHACESTSSSALTLTYRPNYQNVKVSSNTVRSLPVEMILQAVGLPTQIMRDFLPNIPPTNCLDRWVKIKIHVEITEFILYTAHESALVKAVLQRAVDSTLIWDQRKKMLTCPILHERDRGDLKMYHDSRPFGHVTTTLQFYPTVIADHSSKRIGMAEQLYNAKGPFFCVGDPQITHSIIRLEGALKCLEHYDISRAESKQLRFINAVPGAGKTFMIIQAAKATTARMLILTANRASCDELKATLYQRIKEKMVVVATLDSAIMHISKLINAHFESVCIDECYMVHVGQIRLLLGVVEATHVTLYGDRRQIPFINRLKGVGIAHSFMQPDKKNFEEKLITYRCPADICYWMSQLKYGNEMAYSGKVMSKSKTQCVKSVKAHPIQSFTHQMGVNKDKIIVFTQWEKEKLSADLRNAGHHEMSRLIATVHECQGKTFERVALVRIKPAQDEVFTSAPHRLVALTRHTTSLDFYCIRSRIDQGIGRDVELIEKVTEHVARTFLIEHCS